MQNCNGRSTELDPKSKLHQKTEEEESTKLHNYQEAVTSLTYAAITTQPDIAYAAGLVGHFPASVSTLHWQAVKRILRYIRATTEHRLLLGGGIGKQESKLANSLVLTAYADANFGGEIDGMKAMSGFATIDL